MPASAAAAVPSPTVVNHFDSPEAARRYAAHRPRTQSTVLALLESVVGDALPVGRALDVGCGPGHSTVALLPYARRIVGLDASSAMLAAATPHPQIEYRKGHAEALPFRAGDFDLLTVSSAYHWFDHDRFLAEAARVLRSDGWLVLYKAATLGRPLAPAFAQWRREVFKPRFPRAARNHEPLSAEAAAAFGLLECAREERSTTRRHSLDEHLDNLLTHSRVLRALDGSEESVAEVRAWLQREIAPFFPGGTAEFAQEVRFHVLRRQPREPR
jgi:ubiquinone/menaquinone biosynthesis C-methylase UbiE